MGVFRKAKSWRRFDGKKQERRKNWRIGILAVCAILVWGNILCSGDFLLPVSRRVRYEMVQEREGEEREVFGIRLRLKEGVLEFYRKEPIS